jgi:uncharacterized membrane protein
MTALTVWRYDTPFGAEAGAVRLKSLAERKVLTVHDAITIAWMPQAEEPVIGHLKHSTAAKAGKGSILGGLVGMVVLAPLAGAAVGAGVATAAARLRKSGIDEEFVKELGAQLTPGSSALLVLSSEGNLDELRPAMERELDRGDVVLLHAELSEDAPTAIVEAMDEIRRSRGVPED